MSFEYFMWIFTRGSGIALILLALIGISGAFLMGARTQMDLATVMRWTFFPNPNHVVNSNIPDVAIGWATAFWQIMQFLIIILATTHGYNGLRVVIEDFMGDCISAHAARPDFPALAVLTHRGILRDPILLTSGRFCQEADLSGYTAGQTVLALADAVQD
jgi:succinate dehydrogenase hydrophobic anchor subunit